MKKIGKEVFFLPPRDGESRCGEGDLIRLNGGDILYAYTQFYTADREDHAPSRLCGVLSHDEGESFGDPFILLEKDNEAQNIMSVSLVRLKDGALGMAYCRKSHTPDGRLLCMPMFSRSEDEGKRWDAPIVTTPDGYYCGVNGSALVLKSGRILWAFSRHGDDGNAIGAGCIRFAFSDDNGKTWAPLPSEIKSPFPDTVGFAEPGIFEMPDGTLWCYMRSAYGQQYEARSSDGGLHWSAARPNFFFTSPDSPMRVRDFDDYAAAVFNPCGFNCISDKTEFWSSPKRTPLVLTIDRSHGELFDMAGKTAANGDLAALTENTFFLESDTADSYCYPSILRINDGFLVCYYHSNGGSFCLNSTKILKVYDTEID